MNDISARLDGIHVDEERVQLPELLSIAPIETVEALESHFKETRYWFYPEKNHGWQWIDSKFSIAVNRFPSAILISFED